MNLKITTMKMNTMMMTKPMLKLNADLGEGIHIEGKNVAYAVAPYIDMANISCGAHAGDEAHILETIKICLEHKLVLGAHPSYPDRANFGRVSMGLPGEQLKDDFLSQIRWLMQRVNGLGGTLKYIKPHGALYLDMMRDQNILKIIESCLAELDKDLELILQAPLISGAKPSHHIYEAFIDRRYNNAGQLVSRKTHGSVFESKEELWDQFNELSRGQVQTGKGETLKLSFDTLCIHCDNRALVELLPEFKQAITRQKVQLLSEFSYLVKENRSIADLAQRLKKNFPQLIVIPSYENIYLEHPEIEGFDPYAFCEKLQEFVCKNLGDSVPIETKMIDIPIYYAQEVGKDINKVAAELGLSVDEFIQLHSEKAYDIYTVGFLPGFAYLGELPKKLHLARKTQIEKVPAKTLAIAEGQTAIYPLASPGGWHQIGKTPIDFFCKHGDEQGKLILDFQIGNQIRFRPITKEEFLRLGGKL